jgi:uncharacterized Tic20 family protein
VVKFLLALHLVFAIFIVGPLVWAAKTAGRGVRKGDRSLTASSARTLRIYAYVSVLVVIVGMALMSQKTHGRTIAEFRDTWIWLSLVLWAAAVALVLLEIVPTLNRATKLIEAEDSVVTLTMRVAIAGGVVSALFIAIIFLMAYKPGR